MTAHETGQTQCIGTVYEQSFPFGSEPGDIGLESEKYGHVFVPKYHRKSLDEFGEHPKPDIVEQGREVFNVTSHGVM